MQEIWKEIEGTNGMYQVSNLGNVKSFTRIKKGGLLKPGRYSNGYLFVHFAKDTDKKGERHSYLIHRLVAQAFLPNPKGLEQVNHKDENKTNNRVDNLEWCTHLYNQNYGTRNQRVGEKNKISNGKPVYCIELDRVFCSAAEAARFVGRNPTNVSVVCRGKEKSCAGYHWKYVE